MHAVARPTEPLYSEESFRTLQPTPIIEGIIKSCPEDFRVDEQLSFEPAGAGEHLYLDIEKTNANTSWVANQLAEFLGLADVDVSYAGRKDRHAVTRQWFSCYLPRPPEVDWKTFTAEGVSIQGMTWHKSKLRRGQLSHNSFRLVVRFEQLADDQRSELVQRLECIVANGFPNYFGPQRFGTNGGNLEQADKLLRTREKVRGNRGMLMSAARSWLFNQYLARCLDDGTMPVPGVGPLIGKSRDPQPGEEHFDETEQAWAAGLRRLGAKVGERALIVLPEALVWSFDSNTLQLSFRLPPGSYATSLLRELVLVRDMAS